jgi:hypothetical protein
LGEVINRAEKKGQGEQMFGVTDDAGIRIKRIGLEYFEGVREQLPTHGCQYPGV